MSINAAARIWTHLQERRYGWPDRVTHGSWAAKSHSCGHDQEGFTTWFGCFGSCDGGEGLI